MGEQFIKKENVALILGDNFYGQSLTNKLKNVLNLNLVVQFFTSGKKTELYGVATIGKKK